MSGIVGSHLYDNPPECPCPVCGERAVILESYGKPTEAICLAEQAEGKDCHVTEMKPGTEYHCLKCDREEFI